MTKDFLNSISNAEQVRIKEISMRIKDLEILIEASLTYAEKWEHMRERSALRKESISLLRKIGYDKF
jgi:uncharacterized protein with von Willebrand factor type A (vWA) domain